MAEPQDIDLMTFDDAPNLSLEEPQNQLPQITDRSDQECSLKQSERIVATNLHGIQESADGEFKQ